MKQKIMRQRISILFLILLIAVVGVTIVSCSSDEQEFADGGKAIVYGNIVTRATNNDTYVGAIGDNELIQKAKTSCDFLGIEHICIFLLTNQFTNILYNKCQIQL